MEFISMKKIMKFYLIPILIAFGVLKYIEICYQINFVSDVVLLITAGIVFWYTWETYNLRMQNIKQTETLRQTNKLSLISKIHEQLNNEKSYNIRYYLNTEFQRHLARRTKEILGENFVKNHDNDSTMCVDTGKVIKELKEDNDKLNKFNRALRNHINVVGNYNLLDAIEYTLLDFDVIALPFYLGIEPAKEVAIEYEPIIKRTAEVILPFIAIQRQLRGSQDPKYKKPYLYLLQGLKIPLQGLTVPD